MAFALAIKSLFDFPGVGKMFLLLTLLFTAFTMIYSSIFLETTLRKCGIIIDSEEERVSVQRNTIIKDQNLFDQIKYAMSSFSDYNLLPFVVRKLPEKPKEIKMELLADFKKEKNEHE
jgi:hypothetical protein